MDFKMLVVQFTGPQDVLASYEFGTPLYIPF